MIIEVKPFEKAQTDEIILRTRCVKPIMEKEGNEYVLLTEQEIRREPRFSNIKSLYKYSVTKLDYQHQIILYEFIKNRNGLKLHEVEHLFSPTGMGRQIAMALIWQGLLSTDINQKIGPETIVELPTSNGESNKVGVSLALFD